LSKCHKVKFSARASDIYIYDGGGCGGGGVVVNLIVI